MEGKDDAEIHLQSLEETHPEQVGASKKTLNLWEASAGAGSW